MKTRLSLISCWLIVIVLLIYRAGYSEIGDARRNLNITQWDAFGYYQYLPATLIYHDYKKLDWAAEIDKQYNVSGGDGLPVQHLENGNNVCKYLCGVAILQSPFFAIGHIIAKYSGYRADGFSAPYQYALAFGVLLYCLLALLVLRRVLLRYFPDTTVAITLLLLTLASNFIQYAAVHNGLSHAWIFLLYPLLLFTTIKWHERPEWGWAAFTGFIIGLATICRPTEAVALFIPLLWNMHTREASREKWRLVKTHPSHLLFVLSGGIISVLPQLLYWKAVTGSFIYDVGSKWVFLNPWFRVLAGWEKGWFIYTPVAILFVAGMFFMKRYPFRKAVLVYCLLTIWIVISWDDWQYGASYSCRALVQSYPVFALPLAAFVEWSKTKRWRIILYPASVYLIGVNLFQTVQYNSRILHYDEMNRHYYSHIYLNPHPSPSDMSLLDTDEWLRDESRFEKKTLLQRIEPRDIDFSGGKGPALIDTIFEPAPNSRIKWLKISARIFALDHLSKSKLVAELRSIDSVKRTAIRLNNPVGEKTGEYAFYMQIPQYFQHTRVTIYLESLSYFKGTVAQLTVTGFQSKRP